VLKLSNISKRFGGLEALTDVSAAFRAGTVHGVLGENGAGKTTLMRVAAGLLFPDAGSIRVDGRELPFGSPPACAAAGIGMVHQHFMLVPTLTVAENCLIGRRDQGQFRARRKAAGEIAAIGRRLGWEVDPSARVEALSVGQQQRVEIIRALSRAGRVLILDEPTAVLTPQETDQLFAALERLRREGLAIAFISHKLGEVERLCDELTILRRGRSVYQGAAAGLGRDRIVELMVGDAVAPLPARGDAPAPSGREPVLQLDAVHAYDAVSRRSLCDIRLSVRAGEILGVAGVEGNGQDVLAAVIVGTLRADRGRILLNGRDVTGEPVRERAASGLAHVAEDRLRQALVPAMSLAENLVLKSFHSRRFARAGLLRRRAIRDHAAERLARFDVRAGSPLVPVRQLSGGNQQKLVLARELDGEPAVIVAHNPVRGLDVAAARFVFAQLLAQRRRGAGVLLIHSDLDELLAVSDRVAVLYGGRLTLTDWPACDRAAIGRLMLGGRA